MPIAAFVIVIAALAALGWWLPMRARQRVRRRERRHQQLYLKTKRDRTIAGWFRGNRQRRLTYRPTDSESDGSPR